MNTGPIGRSSRLAGILLVTGVFAVLPVLPANAQDDLDALLEPQENGSAEGAADGSRGRKERPREERSAPETQAPPAERSTEATDESADATLRGNARATSPRVIEEIIVTAQKTEQSLRDVPISMSVVDDELMDQEGITDFRDVALYVPNTTIDNSATFPDIRIRGFGSPLSNKAFEQPVALVIDGIPYGRTPYWQGPLFDLDRVEVLRGPQGTLFGKNTTAGLFNVVTKKPTEEFTGFVDAELGELGHRRFQGAIGGPVVPGLLNVRIAGLSDERDGIVRNTTAQVLAEANERMNSRDRKAVRAQLGFPDLFGADLVVSYEHVEIEIVGTGWEFRRVNSDELRFFREYDPGTDVDPENHVGSIDHPEFSSRIIDTVTANAGYELGGWTIDGIAGHSVLSSLNRSDVDFTPASMFFTESVDDNPQTTFELRATSPGLAGLLGLEDLFGLALGNSDVTAGLFWQRRLLTDSRLSIGLNVPVLAQFVAFQNSPSGSVPPLSDFTGTAVSLGDFGTINESAPEESTGFFDQTTNSVAGFTHLNWYLTDRWTLEYGMRFTEEGKDATVSREFTEGTGVAFNAVAGQEEFSRDLSRSEFAFTPKVALRYDWTDDINFFASWARGFKAGGFNELASNGEDEEGLEFGAEKARAWELGSKMNLLGGAARVNLGLFWQNVTDLQVFTLRPEDLVATVVNAGEARARGAELDVTWLPSDSLTVIGALSLNDSEFLEFPFGTCPMDRENTDGDDDPRCDLSGEPLFRTPKWTATLTPNVRIPLSSIPGLSGVPLFPLAGIDLTGGVSGEYQDVQFTQRTLDPRTRQPSFFRFNGNLGLESLGQGWSLRLNVRNMTDEPVAIQTRDVTLGQGTFSHILEEPRIVFGSFRWRF